LYYIASGIDNGVSTVLNGSDQRLDKQQSGCIWNNDNVQETAADHVKYWVLSAAEVVAMVIVAIAISDDKSLAPQQATTRSRQRHCTVEKTRKSERDILHQRLMTDSTTPTQCHHHTACTERSSVHQRAVTGQS